MACGNFYSPLPLVITFLSLSINASAHLSTNFYSTTCPEALCIVEEGVKEAIKKHAKLGASLIRLHFHDCFVNGCDGSVLLDDGPNFKSEKTAPPNSQSLRGFEVVDHIKSKLETACPGVISCADILAIAARDSVVYYGGPSWKVRLGRRDSLTADQTAANNFLPSPSFNLSQLESAFSVQGLSFKNLVALSGSHTVGFAKCKSFQNRIHDDCNIDHCFAKSLERTCLKYGNYSMIQPLDRQTRFIFDNKYYKNLLAKKGLLHSDQELYNGNHKADSLVKKYAAHQSKFFKDFAKAMLKMGNIKPLTGRNGEIRLNCRKPN